MRSSFITQLSEEMSKDDKIILLTGDLGYNALEPIQTKFPGQFINAGIAEANMIGVAAGFALSGYTVFAYSIAPFITMRCLEQIKLDVCYHNLNVKLVGVGGGFNYGSQGVTHHAPEDVAIMRVLPEMKTLIPASAWEAEQATKVMVNTAGPFYIRLGIKIANEVHKPDDKFSLGKGYLLKPGLDFTIINTGNTLDVAQEIIDNLEAKGIIGELLHLPTVKPLDQDLIIKSAKKTKSVFTLEESSVAGGFGSAVAELLLREKINLNNFHIFGIPDRFIKDVGSPKYLRKMAGLDAETITRTITSLIS